MAQEVIKVLGVEKGSTAITLEVKPLNIGKNKFTLKFLSHLIFVSQYTSTYVLLFGFMCFYIDSIYNKYELL